LDLIHLTDDPQEVISILRAADAERAISHPPVAFDAARLPHSNGS
jgi:hypothetical protein